MFKKIIILLIFSILVFENVSAKRVNPKFRTFKGIVEGIREGNPSLLRNMNYDTLMEVSSYIRVKAQQRKTPFALYLTENGPNRWRKGTVKSITGGLSNRDPRVRIFSAHLLLKLSPKRSWFDKELQMVLDPQGLNSETVDRTYIFTDIYGRIRGDNIKDALNRLVDLGNEIILLSPNENEKTYQNRSLDFEWSTVYGATSYDFYVQNIDSLYHIDYILLYRGNKSFLNIRRKFSYGGHKWLVVAKDRWGKIITSTETRFYIKELETPRLRIIKGLASDQPKFRWYNIKGAIFYELKFLKNKGKIQNLYSSQHIPIEIDTAIFVNQIFKKIPRRSTRRFLLSVYFRNNLRKSYILINDLTYRQESRITAILKKIDYKQTSYTITQELPIGTYTFFLVARNYFQKKASPKIIVIVSSKKKRKFVRIIDTSKKTIEPKKVEKNLEFDLTDYKDIEEENEEEEDEEEELDFDIDSFKDLEKE